MMAFPIFHLFYFTQLAIATELSTSKTKLPLITLYKKKLFYTFSYVIFFYKLFIPYGINLSDLISKTYLVFKINIYLVFMFQNTISS